MARLVVELAAEIQLAARPMNWTVGRAKYAKSDAWGNVDGVAGDWPVLCVIKPTCYAGLITEIPDDPPPGYETLTNKLVEVLICDVPPGSQRPDEHPIDGWKMRDAFLRLKFTPDSLCDFLNQWGNWNSECDPRLRKGKWRPQVVHPSSIWHDHDKRGHGPQGYWSDTPAKSVGELAHIEELPWTCVQDIIRWGLRAKSADWFNSGYPSLMPSLPRSTYPYFSLEFSGGLDILYATITLDHIRNIKHRFCCRPDCRMPFPVQSQHKRQFCSQYCGHLESLRKQRRKAKQEKKHATRKG